MREKRIVTIDDAGREITFSVQQMPALKLEKWIYKTAIQLAKANGAEIAGESITDAKAAIKKLEAGDKDGSGMGWIIQTVGGLDFDKVEPLLDELLSCVKVIPDANNSAVEMALTPATIEGQIESPLTLMKIRVETLKVNFSFFSTAVKSKAAEEKTHPKILIRKNTKT